MLTQNCLKLMCGTDLKEGEPGALSYLVTASRVWYLLKHCLERACCGCRPEYNNKFN